MEIDDQQIELRKDIVASKDTDRKSEEINSIKILKDISSLGCSDKAIVAATYRVYLDLCEVRKYHEVSYHYNSTLDHLYLKSRKKKEDPEEVTIPLLSIRKYSFMDFEKYQDVFESDVINIAICDSNAIAVYKLTKSS